MTTAGYINDRSPDSYSGSDGLTPSPATTSPIPETQNPRKSDSIDAYYLSRLGEMLADLEKQMKPAPTATGFRNEARSDQTIHLGDCKWTHISPDTMAKDVVKLCNNAIATVLAELPLELDVQWLNIQDPVENPLCDRGFIHCRATATVDTTKATYNPKTELVIPKDLATSIQHLCSLLTMHDEVRTCNHCMAAIDNVEAELSSHGATYLCNSSL